MLFDEFIEHWSLFYSMCIWYQPRNRGIAFLIDKNVYRKINFLLSDFVLLVNSNNVAVTLETNWSLDTNIKTPNSVYYKKLFNEIFLYTSGKPIFCYLPVSILSRCLWKWMWHVVIDVQCEKDTLQSCMFMVGNIVLKTT